jgi:hypothetical protein
MTGADTLIARTQLHTLVDYDVTGLSAETVEVAVTGAVAFVAAVRSLSPGGRQGTRERQRTV